MLKEHHLDLGLAEEEEEEGKPWVARLKSAWRSHIFIHKFAGALWELDSASQTKDDVLIEP